MNYFNHVNHFFELVQRDSRLTPIHISIYIVLLHLWNKNHYAASFTVNKAYILNLTKIGSEHTYYNRLAELHYWKYIEFIPGKNGVIKSKFKLKEFTTETTEKLIQNIIELQNCSTAHLDVVALQKCSDTTSEMQSYQCKNAVINTRHKRQIIHKDSLEQKTLLFDFESEVKEERKKVPQKKESETKRIPSEQDIAEFFTSNNSTIEVGQKFYLYYSETGWVNKNNCLITDWQSAAKRWILSEYTVKPTKSTKNKSDRDYDKAF